MEQTVDDVIEALGGTTALARSLGMRPTRVSNWRTFGRFPDSISIYQKIKRLCDEAGIALDPRLFEQTTSAA